MAMLTNSDTDEKITKFVSVDTGQSVIRATQEMLDGQVYIQRIGNPTVTYTVIAYVDRNGKSLLMKAEDTADLLKASVKHGIYLGRITSLKFSERMVGDWFKATLVLVKEVDA